MKHFIHKPPTLSDCRCGSKTIDGIDSGVPYRVDGIPLNLKGELQARITGRVTYRAVRKPGFTSVVYRTAHDIKTETGGPVVAQHTCTGIKTEHISVPDIAAMREFIDHCQPATESVEQDALLVLNRQLGATVLELPPPF